MSETLTIAVPKVKKLTVDLGGEIYKVTPIKGTVAMKMSGHMKKGSEDPEVLQGFFQKVIDVIFSKKDAKRINERLEDTSDGLDVFHIMELVNVMIERATDTPFTSPSD